MDAIDVMNFYNNLNKQEYDYSKFINMVDDYEKVENVNAFGH